MDELACVTHRVQNMLTRCVSSCYLSQSIAESLSVTQSRESLSHLQAHNGGICVANHTSPIDAMILACDNCYAMIGQRHGGFLGIVQVSYFES